MLNFCTLFNSDYLEKALVLYDSLVEHCADFALYILTMDQKAYDVLSDMRLDHVMLIRLEEFEDDELRGIKALRNVGEYCWTCTPKLVYYCLQQYDCDMVTYIDADLCFYADPMILIREMLDFGQSVQVVPHNFSVKSAEIGENENGKYCVQFNTFKNTDESIGLLKEWIRNCINECSYETMGDQKYLDGWEKYPFVNVCKNLGAGVAPWNINRFIWKMKNDRFTIQDGVFGIKHGIVFYHFQGIRDVDGRMVSCVDTKRSIYRVIRLFYAHYLSRIHKYRVILADRYGINPMIRLHPAQLSTDSDTETAGSAIERSHSLRVRLQYTRLFITWDEII